MKSPVVIFNDTSAATKQRAKLSQEGSYIPTFINISIKKITCPRTIEQIRRKENQKKLARIDSPL
jgi:hypothetical protein